MPRKKRERKNLPEVKDAYGIIGLVLAIISLLSMGSNGIIYALLGVIFSKMQQKKSPNKIGNAGLIVGIVGIILNIVFIIFLMIYYPTILQNLQSQLGA